ncbi:MAG: permease [Candidatus Electrothrix sp. Rat3]|nr:permease [Candidatus Electrothrix rattekaaiensis]
MEPIKPTGCCGADAELHQITDEKKQSEHNKHNEHNEQKEQKIKRAAWGICGIALWFLLYKQLLPFSHWFAYTLLGLTPGGHLGEAVQFFVYDTPKVMMLLLLIVFAVGIVRSFFTPEKTRSLLAGKRESTGNILAAALGIVTPFCSCSAVPLFIGFVQAGVPLGVTLSFLIAAPMVNEVALVLLYGLLGWKIAGLYLMTGLAVAIVSGWIIGRFNMESSIEDWVREIRAGEQLDMGIKLTWTDRIEQGKEAVRDIVGKVWPYVIAGIGVGATIHGYVPEDFMAAVMGKDAWWSVPGAVLVGIPMYSNAAGIVPIVEALLGKGAALGTVLAFMMSVIALSLPEIVILRKVLKPKLIGVFIAVVGGGILLTGFLFNLII